MTTAFLIVMDGSVQRVKIVKTDLTWACGRSVLTTTVPAVETIHAMRTKLVTRTRMAMTTVFLIAMDGGVQVVKNVKIDRTWVSDQCVLPITLPTVETMLAMRTRLVTKARLAMTTVLLIAMDGGVQVVKNVKTDRTWVSGRCVLTTMVPAVEAKLAMRIRLVTKARMAMTTASLIVMDGGVQVVKNVKTDRTWVSGRCVLTTTVPAVEAKLAMRIRLVTKARMAMTTVLLIAMDGSVQRVKNVKTDRTWACGRCVLTTMIPAVETIHAMRTKLVTRTRMAMTTVLLIAMDGGVQGEKFVKTDRTWVSDQCVLPITLPTVETMLAMRTRLVTKARMAMTTVLLIVMDGGVQGEKFVKTDRTWVSGLCVSTTMVPAVEAKLAMRIRLVTRTRMAMNTVLLIAMDGGVRGVKIVKTDRTWVCGQCVLTTMVPAVEAKLAMRTKLVTRTRMAMNTVLLIAMVGGVQRVKNVKTDRTWVSGLCVLPITLPTAEAKLAMRTKLVTKAHKVMNTVL